MMNIEKATELLKKYEENTISREDKALLETWYIQQAAQSSHQLSDSALEESFQFLKAQLPVKYTKQTKLWPRMVTVAAALAAIVFGAWFFSARNAGHRPELISGAANYANDIAPGKNTATLTLANGKTIDLSDAKTGVVIGDHKLAYSDGSVIEHTNSGAGQKDASVENLTASTPRGGTYQIVLPDGTKVWLNAASSLKFPSAFTGLSNRKVELSGEAYFEVHKDKMHPFIVNTGKQQVEVLGTHFNINAYENESATKTTLFEGAVKINNDVVLKPGEQSILTGNKQINVVPADFDETLAWKTGFFKFDNDENITSIMREVERWYDVEVVYVGDMKEVNFTGRISRFKNISSLLKKMEQTEMVKFKIEGRKVTAIKL